MTPAQHLRNQWRTAARQLGVEIILPFSLRNEHGHIYEFACLLPQFGSEKGMLLMATYNDEAAVFASQSGYGYSCLAPEPNSSVNLEGCIDCLKDWGWSVPGQSPPEWYK